VPYDQIGAKVCPVGRSKHKINPHSYILHIIIYIHSRKGSFYSTEMGVGGPKGGEGGGGFNELS
jgi:hypothetical protein